MHVMFLFLLSIAFLEYLDLKNFSIIKDLMQVHAAARISQLEERSIRKNNQQVNQLKTAIR